MTYKDWPKYPLNRPCKGMALFKSQNGAITVEYVMAMVVASGFMLGIEFLFRDMAIRIINGIKAVVGYIPS